MEYPSTFLATMFDSFYCQVSIYRKISYPKIGVIESRVLLTNRIGLFVDPPNGPMVCIVRFCFSLAVQYSMKLTSKCVITDYWPSHAFNIEGVRHETAGKRALRLKLLYNAFIIILESHIEYTSSGVSTLYSCSPNWLNRLIDNLWGRGW
jgi:hypothetical protein